MTVGESRNGRKARTGEAEQESPTRGASSRSALATRRVAAALTVLFVLTVPVFLVTSNVLWAFNSPRLYGYGFQKYQISQQMGMPAQELERVAAELRAYFNSSMEQADIRYAGQPLFNQREVAHLRDVKGLLRSVAAIRWATLGYLLAFVLGGLVWSIRSGSGRALARAAAWGGGLTLALLALFALAFLVAFDWAFVLFHRLSFANDFWQLDSARDNLVRMFPEGFWFDAAMFIVLATAVEAALLLVIGVVALRLLRQAPRPATETNLTGQT